VFEDLNEDQHRAATAAMDHPTLVLAGAGTGKTTTVTARVVWLIEQGVASERIVLLTFTRRAAREMLARARTRLGSRSKGAVVGGTFHSVAHRIVRMHASSLALADGFGLLDPSDTADLLDLIREELGLADGSRRFPRKSTLADIYSRTINTQQTLSRVLAASFPWCIGYLEPIGEVFRTFVERKRQLGVLDFDDLLLCWDALLRDDHIGRHITSRFDHVLVDEYQDVNAVQVAITDTLAAEHHGLTVVGDDMQAIYSFRAADPLHLTEFPARHTDALVVKLERNYRSTQPILDATNALAAQAHRSLPRHLRSSRPGHRRPELLHCRDEVDEATMVSDAVLALREEGTPLREQAVLVRSAHHSDLLELELTRRQVPFVKFGGLRYLDAAHVKDYLASMRVATNRTDTLGWFRLLQLLEGVGPARARQIIDELPLDIGELARAWPTATVPDAARDTGKQLLHAIDPGRVLRAGAHAERLYHAMEPLIRGRYADADARLDDLRELAAAASAFDQLQNFVCDLVLDAPRSSSDLAGPPHLDEEYLVISTIHSAKGLEWDAVHLLRATDGNIPSDMALGERAGLDEERRVLYVAMTRARRVLRVMVPQRYYHRPSGRDDAHGYAKLTRFLDPGTLEHFDAVRHDDDDSSPLARSPATPGHTVGYDLDALWR
jgi:DNA helicase-2/ATP-dependent DNA helicase PcrA